VVTLILLTYSLPRHQ